MDSHVEEVSLPPTHGVAVRATLPVTQLSGFLGPAFLEAIEVVERAGARVVGPPFARYLSAPPGPVDVEAVVPIDHSISGTGRVYPVELPPGAALKVRYVGPYDEIGPVYAELGRWMSEHHRQPADAPREVYLTDPQLERNPRYWVTLVIQPIQGGNGVARRAA